LRVPSSVWKISSSVWGVQSSVWEVSSSVWEVPSSVWESIILRLSGSILRLRGIILRLRGIVYCPRTEHDTSQTEDETQGTFTLNCINATTAYQDYSPWRWPSRVETDRRLSRILYIFGALVGIYLFRMMQCTDMEHIKFRNEISSAVFSMHTQNSHTLCLGRQDRQLPNWNGRTERSAIPIKIGQSSGTDLLRSLKRYPFPTRITFDLLSTPVW
jgi:hypothetical protein